MMLLSWYVVSNYSELKGSVNEGNDFSSATKSDVSNYSELKGSVK